MEDSSSARPERTGAYRSWNVWDWNFINEKYKECNKEIKITNEARISLAFETLGHIIKGILEVDFPY